MKTSSLLRSHSKRFQNYFLCCFRICIASPQVFQDSAFVLTCVPWSPWELRPAAIVVEGNEQMLPLLPIGLSEYFVVWSVLGRVRSWRSRFRLDQCNLPRLCLYGIVSYQKHRHPVTSVVPTLQSLTQLQDMHSAVPLLMEQLSPSHSSRMDLGLTRFWENSVGVEHRIWSTRPRRHQRQAVLSVREADPPSHLLRAFSKTVGLVLNCQRFQCLTLCLISLGSGTICDVINKSWLMLLWILSRPLGEYHVPKCPPAEFFQSCEYSTLFQDDCNCIGTGDIVLPVVERLARNMVCRASRISNSLAGLSRRFFTECEIHRRLPVLCRAEQVRRLCSFYLAVVSTGVSVVRQCNSYFSSFVSFMVCAAAATGPVPYHNDLTEQFFVNLLLLWHE